MYYTCATFQHVLTYLFIDKIRMYYSSFLVLTPSAFLMKTLQITIILISILLKSFFHMSCRFYFLLFHIFPRHSARAALGCRRAGRLVLSGGRGCGEGGGPLARAHGEKIGLTAFQRKLGPKKERQLGATRCYQRIEVAQSKVLI